MSEHIDGFALIDRRRSADLDDVGGAGFTLAMAVDSAGAEHIGIVERRVLGHGMAGFSLGSPEHENVGALPLDMVRRIAIAQRTHRCGRRTKAGRPCRIRITQPGAGCARHSKPTTERNRNA